MDPITAVVLVVVVLLVLVIAWGSIRIAREYERGVVFRLGRLINLKGPGIFFILPFGVDRLTKVDLRVVAQDVPTQEVVTLDNVTVKVNAVVFYQVVDARAAITRVFSYSNATMLISQTTLRSVLGQSSLDELLAGRDKISVSLQQIIDQHTEPWGIKVSNVEIKYVELPGGRRALRRRLSLDLPALLRQLRIAVAVARREHEHDQQANPLHDALEIAQPLPDTSWLLSRLNVGNWFLPSAPAVTFHRAILLSTASRFQSTPISLKGVCVPPPCSTAKSQ